MSMVTGLKLVGILFPVAWLYNVITPAVVIFPIDAIPPAVNHKLPSGPTVMLFGFAPVLRL